MQKNIVIGFSMVLVMGLLGFNEFYRMFQSFNWMIVSFFLMFVIAVALFIKIFAVKEE